MKTRKRRGNLNGELEHLRLGLNAPWTTAERAVMDAQAAAQPHAGEVEAAAGQPSSTEAVPPRP
jgi:hypothetical protein